MLGFQAQSTTPEFWFGLVLGIKPKQARQAFYQLSYISESLQTYTLNIHHLGHVLIQGISTCPHVCTPESHGLALRLLSPDPKPGDSEWTDVCRLWTGGVGNRLPGPWGVPLSSLSWRPLSFADNSFIFLIQPLSNTF